MVKKISHIILSFLLLIATVGVSINAHYCGDTIKSIALNTADHHCCGGDMCGQCENHHVTYRISGDYLSTVSVTIEEEMPSFNLFGMSGDLFILNPYSCPSILKYSAEYNPSLHAPPPFPEFTQSFLC